MGKSVPLQVGEPFYCSVTDAGINQRLFDLLLTTDGKDMTASGFLTHTQWGGSPWANSRSGGWNDPGEDVDGSFYTDGANIVTQVGPFACTGNPVTLSSAEDSNDLEWKLSSGSTYETADVRCKITCFGRDPTVSDRGCRLYLCEPMSPR